MKIINFLKNQSDVIVSFFIVFCFCVLIFGIATNTLDYIVYFNRTKITTKDEMFQFVTNNQKELEQIVQEVISTSVEMNESRLLIEGKNKKKHATSNIKKLMKKYPIKSIYMKKDEDGTVKVKFEFAFCPEKTTYWGIYYTSDGEPAKWGATKEDMQVDENNVYTETGSFYVNTTENIVGNWYIYQCWVP